MAEVNPPVWMQAGTYSAGADRIITGLLSDRNRGLNGLGTGVIGGVVPGFAQLLATPGNTTMLMTIATGTLLIPSVGVSPPGAYVCHNEGNKVLTLDIAATADPRIDVIYAEVEDETTGGSVSEWRFGVQKGNPSSSPQNPTLTAGRFPLYAVRILPAASNGGQNKITSAQVTDLRIFNTAPGGVYLTRNGLPNPPKAPGRLMYNHDSGSLQVCDTAGTWQPLLTYKQWMDVHASVRPKHTFWSGNKTIATGAGNVGNWTAITDAKVEGIRTPSGAVRVTLSCFGRLTAAGGWGHVSVRILQGATTKAAPLTGGGQSTTFYGQIWEKNSATFIVEGLPINSPSAAALSARLEFYRAGNDANTFIITQPYLLVEPIL